MKTFKKIAPSILLIGILFFSNSALVSAAFNPTGGGTYRLQSSIGLTDTSIRLSSFNEPVSNTPYTMAYLNSNIEFGTIDPQTSRPEFISFTGITNNTDGSATLTGVSRGLSPSYPFATASSTTFAQAHPGQSVFIMSDPPQLFGKYANKSNNELIQGQWTASSTNPWAYDNAFNVTSSSTSLLIPYISWIFNNFVNNYAAQNVLGLKTFTTLPQSAATPSATSDLTTKTYVDSQVIAGGTNASESVQGVSQLATKAQANAGTSVGSTGARLVLPASMATTTNQVATTSIVMTKANGIIDSSLLPAAVSGTSFTQNFFSIPQTKVGDLVYLTSSTTNVTSQFFWNQSTNNQNVGIGDQAGQLAIAESFSETPTLTFNTVRVGLQRVGNPTDYLVVKFETDNAGVPSGTVLAAATTSAQLISSAGGTYDFPFPNSTTTLASTRYWIVLSRTAPVNATNFIQDEQCSGGCYAGGGSGKTFAFNGTTWSAQNNTLVGGILQGYVVPAVAEADNAASSTSETYVGAVSVGAAAGGTATVVTHGLATGFLGLQPGFTMFVGTNGTTTFGGGPGASTSPYVVKRAGYALSTTTALINSTFSDY